MILQCSFSRIYFTVTVSIQIFQITYLPKVIILKERKVFAIQI